MRRCCKGCKRVTLVLGAYVPNSIELQGYSYKFTDIYNFETKIINPQLRINYNLILT